MKRQRRAYAPEFKDEAVKLVVNTGRPVAQVASEVGVPPQTLGKWVSAYQERVGKTQPLTESERAELKRLRRQVRELELDRAFLKKRQSSSPRKPRIHSSGLQIDAGGEEEFHHHTHGQTP